MAIAVVGELVVGGGEFLEALGGDAGEVAGEFGELGDDYGAPGDEAVYEGLLAHVSLSVYLSRRANPINLGGEREVEPVDVEREREKLRREEA